jgi:hypothetical protein
MSWLAPSVVKAQPPVWLGPPTIQPNGTTVRMPQSRPVSRKSKLQMSIDSRWANNYGYRPVSVTVTSQQPATADRLITVRLNTSGWSWQKNRLSVEEDFELPMGKTSVTTTIACPQYQLDGRFFWWEVWVDGVRDNDLSLDEDDSRNTAMVAFNPGAQGGVNCLVVRNSGPGVGSSRSLVATNSGEFQILSVSTNELPREWIELTCFDVVALDLNALRSLPQAAPEAFQALQRWTRAGGQLWISDVGQNLENLAELSKLLHLQASIVQFDDDLLAEGITMVEKGKATEAVWRPVQFLDGNPEGQVVTFMDVNTGELRSETDPDVIAQLQNDPNFVTQDQQVAPLAAPAPDPDPSRRRGRRRETDSGKWFVEQRMGFGVVRALRGPNELALFAQGRLVPTVTPQGIVVESPVGQPGMGGLIADAGMDPATGQLAGRMAPALGMNLRSTHKWDQRHGMTPDNANFEFANLLVPGVGLAPVTEFRVLITLFVLLIGPANYWFLKRFRRMHLLVLTVPLAALLTTAALFAYAILADGFSTTVRAHSLTTLDQRTGEAACWSRLSYYSGMAPGEGLTLPADVAAYPIIPGWNEGNINADTGGERELLWEPTEAKLTRGWLRSRTPTQLLTVRARKSPHTLELLSANGKLRATNKLGTTIEFVLALDAEGNFFAGENLPADSRGELIPIARDQAVRRFRDLVRAHQPEAPAALSAPDSDFMLMQRRQQMRQFRRSGFQYANERLSTNLAGQMLLDLTEQSGTNLPLDLPSNSYVAITETGPEVAIGMAGVEEDESFHVIVGQL